MTRPPPLPLGKYLSEWVIDSNDTCPKCIGTAVEHRIWESSDGANEDVHYRCLDCGHDWWIDGADA